MPPTNKAIGYVLSCSPGRILVEIADLKTFEDHKTELQIGRYLKIAQGNSEFTVAVITNVTGDNMPAQGTPPNAAQWRFRIESQAIGALGGDGKFERGSVLLPVPTEPVYVADKAVLDALFQSNDRFNMPMGSLSMNRQVQLHIDGDRFFGKHAAVVGSTGSGKSCAVAKILQDAVGIDCGRNNNRGKQNNAHIVLFDLHAEYAAAFTLEQAQGFTLNLLDVSTLKLPYWLMNSEELESMFIESNEQNSHNQVSQFKHAVILNKQKHNPGIKDITYDTPVYFSMEQVYHYIDNMNREVIGKKPGENLPKLADAAGTLVKDRALYFDKPLEFVPWSTSRDDRASTGPFNGEFDRFVSRLETKLADKRLDFLLHPMKDGQPYKTADFETIMKQFLSKYTKVP